MALAPSELFRTVRESELAKTSIPVALVVAFGVAWASVRPDFFWQDDFQTQYLPASREIARALSAGELPILSRNCWYGAALAGEYQHGVFSLSTLIITWLVWKLGLTLSGTATALSLSHHAILAAGAFRLARSRRLSVQEATLVAVIACLNGWLISWGKSWYPALTSFAWVPWTWWALERALGGTRTALHTVLAGVFLYSILAAGWPISVLIVAVLSVCLVARAWLATRQLRTPWPALAAWVIAFGLAAPALLTFVEYSASTLRVVMEDEAPLLDRQWQTPFSALSGMILPAIQAWWRSYQGNWSQRASVELAGGLVPLCAIACAVAVRGARPLRRFDTLIAFLALSFAALPCVRPFQSSFRWLPMLQLSFALVGASSLRALAEQVRARVWVASIALSSIAFTLLMALGDDADPTPLTLELGKWLLKLALLWLLLERFAPRLLAGWGPVAFTLASLSATYSVLPPLPDAPVWTMDESMREPAPFEPQRRYLALFDIAALIQGHKPAGERPYWTGSVPSLRPGYSAMYADLQFVNGYSSMRPLGPAGVLDMAPHGEIGPRAGELLRSETGEGGLLDLMATDGLVLAKGLLAEVPALEANGWKRVATVADGVVLHRQRAASLRARSLASLDWIADRKTLFALLHHGNLAPAATLMFADQSYREEFVEAQLGQVVEERRSSRVQVSVPAGERAALVMFARPALPGWRAWLNGRRLKVVTVNELMPAVRVPPGSQGELVLEYSPRSLRRGAWSMAITLVVALAWLLWERRAQRARVASSS